MPRRLGWSDCELIDPFPIVAVETGISFRLAPRNSPFVRRITGAGRPLLKLKGANANHFGRRQSRRAPERSGPVGVGGFKEGELERHSPAEEVAAQIGMRRADAIQLAAEEI